MCFCTFITYVYNNKCVYHDSIWAMLTANFDGRQSERARERERARRCTVYNNNNLNDNGVARWPIINGYGWPGLAGCGIL